jgi:phenylalanyl-tRNA synthetase alpha chain
MSQESLIRALHPLEVKALAAFGGGEPFSAARLEKELGFKPGQSNQALSWLAAKGLIEETERRRSVAYALTELGRQYKEHGTLEERLVGLLAESGPLSLPEIASRLGIEAREVGSAFGALSKAGVLAMDAQKRAVPAGTAPVGGAGPAPLAAQRALFAMFEGRETVPAEELDSGQTELIGAYSRRRGAEKGAFRVVEREEVGYRLTASGLEVSALLKRQGVGGQEIGVITPELLQSGAWRQVRFRAYNLAAPAQRVALGRKNPYVEFLEDLKDKLVALGFEEFDGPLLETEFWNCDALFMPQFHSARDIHDVYHVKKPTHARHIEQPYLDQVAAAHENGWTTGSLGWRYPFDRTFTRRMILRSQGTVLSAKQLPKAKVPGKYFGVVRCFRYDRVDATHLADFYQTEGIVLGEEVNLRTLLGLLKMFAVEVAGAKEFKFVPGYFPFTEPSVEAHIRHPELGWFELGGSGIFRPEVTRPLGIEVPVLAWGLGIDRMALVAMGLNDLRDLFTPDIEQVRLRRKK